MCDVMYAQWPDVPGRQQTFIICTSFCHRDLFCRASASSFVSQAFPVFIYFAFKLLTPSC